LRGQG
jgi:hypothetical protein